MSDSTMTVRDLVNDSWQTAEDKGWHDEPRSFGDLIALCHSELSEALEDFRHGHSPDEMWFEDSGKPCGIPSELADVVIRICDMSKTLGIDLDAALEAKRMFNRTRAHRHGGKVM